MRQRTALLTAGRWKQTVANLLTSRLVSRAIGIALRHRIPNNGLLFSTEGFPATVNSSLFFNIYESAEIRFVRRYFADQPTIVELGGSVGIVGSHALAVASPTAEIVTVEANPFLVPILKGTLGQHAREMQSFRIVEAAIADRDGEAEMWVNGSSLGGHLVTLPRADTVTVEAITLATLLRNNDVTSYALIADIEGAEEHVLWGQDEALQGCDLAVFELHGPSRTILRMMDRLDEVGLHIIDQHGPVVVARRLLS